MRYPRQACCVLRIAIMFVLVAGIANAAAAKKPPSKYALYFPAGGGKHVRVEAYKTINFSGPFSVEAWVRPELSARKGLSFIVSKNMGGTGYALLISNGRYGFECNGKDGLLISKQKIKPNVWTHVCAVWSQGTGRLYIDGKLDAKKPMPHPPLPNNHPLLVGGSPFGVATGWQGGIGDARLWGKALRQREIVRRRNHCLNGDEKGLVGYWPFSEGRGQVVGNLAPNGNHGTLGNRKTRDGCDPNWLLPETMKVLRPAPPKGGIVKAMVDLTHEWTFYFHDRFSTAYIVDMGGECRASNRSLAEMNLKSFNLLVLHQARAPVEYTVQEIGIIKRFVETGGGALFAGFRSNDKFPMNKAASIFGCEFTRKRVVHPVSYDDKRFAEKLPRLVFSGGRALKLFDRGVWRVLVADATGAPVVAVRKYGKGAIAMVGAPEMWGDKPKAGKPAQRVAANTRFTQKLLRALIAGKPAPTGNPYKQRFDPELTQKVSGVTLVYPANLEVYAKDLGLLYKRIEPVQEAIMGVPLSPGSNQKIYLLATGDGGWSSGVALGIGVFWGGWPKTRYPMVEMVAHESTHSWVLPFTEPLGNESIAIYVGMEVGKKLGYEKEATLARKRLDAQARKLDPGYRAIDVTKPEQRSLHAIWMGKYMHIIDTLRAKYDDDIMARYFRLKRKHATRQNLVKYTADDSIFLWGLAAGEDLFPWFRENFGIDARKERSLLAKKIKP